MSTNKNQIIRPAELAKLLSISIPTLYRRIKEKNFPPKIVLSKQGRAVGWRLTDIESYLDACTENKTK